MIADEIGDFPARNRRSGYLAATSYWPHLRATAGAFHEASPAPSALTEIDMVGTGNVVHWEVGGDIPDAKLREGVAVEVSVGGSS